MFGGTQSDSDSCGLFTLMHIEAILKQENQNIVVQKNINLYKRKIINRIINFK